MKMKEQHYLPCPICGQSCRAEVALGYSEKSSVRNVVAFGHGFYGVDIGTLGDHPAVFIIPNEKPGPVGERVPLDLQIPLERDLLPDDWTVLLFPTRDRCKEVADALVGSKMVKWRNDPPGPSDPAQEPEAVAWIDFADNGNVRLWTHDKSRMAAEVAEGRKMTPVYTRPVSLDREAEDKSIRALLVDLRNFIDPKVDTPHTQKALRLRLASALRILRDRPAT